VTGIQHELLTALDTMSGGFAPFEKGDRLVVWDDPFAEFHQDIGTRTYFGVTFEKLFTARIAAGLTPDAKGREEAWMSDRMAQHRKPNGRIAVTNREEGRIVHA